jgi:anaerobic dimethyl sulfoxide reductase subunit B (iron-sulfur subunit)
MAKQLGFYFDSTLCTGCKACQIACKDKNDLPVGVTWRRVAEYSGGSWVKVGAAYQHDVFTYYTSVACNHCENPACVGVCPAQAITKREDGVVLIDQEKCIGCRYCTWACPYDAPQFDEAIGKVSKCNFCADYLAEGQDPACVAACPSRALHFGELSELQAKYGTTNAVEPLPDPSITTPSLVINPHKDAEVTGAGTGKLANPEEI